MNGRWTSFLRALSVTAAVGILVFLGLVAGKLHTTTSQPSPIGHTPISESIQQVVSAAPYPKSSVLSRYGVLQIPKGATLVPDKLLVHFKKTASAAERASAISNVHATVAATYHLVPGLELLHLPKGSSVGDAVAILSSNPAVKYASPDLSVKVALTPNDPSYSSQWALSAIGAPAAWDHTTGSANVTVAVLDTGASLTHPDLTANLVQGWNFVNNTNSPADDYGHGTHVAGIIGATGNNGVGISGVSWHVSLMPLKICDSTGSCDLDKEVSALQYAVDHGAKIANASFGGNYGGYQPEEDAISAAGQAGVLYVAAAGNNQQSNDLLPFYPASYPLDNILSVAATNNNGPGGSNQRASFSDFGFNTVSIAAPGQDILSTLPTSGPLSNSSGYGKLSGTSMAAPQVSGAAALLWAEHPDWTLQQIRTRLLTTASPMASLIGRVADCGQLNIGAATDTNLPDQGVICVKLTGTGAGSVASDTGGINCGTTCVASVVPGTSLTLSANSISGSTFVGWSGACSGNGACSVTVNQISDVTATFQASGDPTGWQQEPLTAPRDPYVTGSDSNQENYYNVAVSADGSERAKTIYNPPGKFCNYNSDDTGGVFLEHLTNGSWAADGKLTAPSVPAYSGDPVARWANCNDFGATTQLSSDGTTLLVTPSSSYVTDPNTGASHYRCAAYLYKKGSNGWTLDTTLYPPGVDAGGSATWDGCGYFGNGGEISANGTRVAMPQVGLNSLGKTVLRADIYTLSQGTWSLEQQLTLPRPNDDCAHTLGPRNLSMSGDGTTLLFGDDGCDDTGTLYSAGLVYAYTRSGTQWTLTQTIHSPSPTQYQHFGNETALSQDGNTATIGNAYINPTHSIWVFERNQSGWHMSVLLPHASPLPNTTVGTTFSCPTIVQNGAEVICGNSDGVGSNANQGSIYVFGRPMGGWSTQGRTTQEAFATDGLEYDHLGLGGPYGWITLAAPEDGSFIDAPISPTRYVTGVNPHDRIGYEFATGGAYVIPPTDKTLSVNTSGGGYGSVTSNPAGIDCGSTCTADFPNNSSITLTATPASGSIFTGWSGDCSGTGSCTLGMNSNHSATATFSPTPPAHETLTSVKAGNGSGSITSSPAGINCGSTCTTNFTTGISVTLTAAPATGSAFTGWSGDCFGTGSCMVTMGQARSVTATFSLIPETFNVTKSGNGSGSIASSPAGIDCGSTCTYAYNYGTTVTLTPQVSSGSVFTGWSGDCLGTGLCVLPMTQARNANATFKLLESLSVTKSGNGSGSIASSPVGISCGLTCTHLYVYGTVVTLTPRVSTGSSFTGWSGACPGTGSCTIAMTQARSVTATFKLIPETLNVYSYGSGSVTSSPVGISCGSFCTHSFNYGTLVTLTARPSYGHVFTGWSGACSGTTSTCKVSMIVSRTVNAKFT